MLNLNAVFIFSQNPGKLAEFYEKILEVKPMWSQGDYRGYQIGEGSLMIGFHDKVKGNNPNPDRIIINYETDDVESEFSRIQALGAEVVAKPYHPGESPDMMIATFADPFVASSVAKFMAPQAPAGTTTQGYVTKGYATTRGFSREGNMRGYTQVNG